jgi:adenosylcobyric acid synthase
MSNNAAATPEGGEIGRAQALQAQAAGLVPHVDFNPVLLKPQSETGAQIIVQGKPHSFSDASTYGARKAELLGHVIDSFSRLRDRYDLVIVEGAGSPAEVNLRPRDIANMGFAEAADVPVVLCGDIDRGGVIAQIVGTQAVLSAQDRARICGFVVNKFRGDPALFEDGYRFIEDKTAWRGLGLVPWFDAAWQLPAEDAQSIKLPERTTGLHVVCLRLPRIANFDDLDPLAQEERVRLTMLAPGRALPGDADVVILPGSKSTRQDLAFLRDQGWDIDLQAHRRRGGHILGMCGGYQMLGRQIADPQGVEGTPGTDQGLAFLDVDTLMLPDKQVRPVTATHVGSGLPLQGYEIHVGQTAGPDCARPFAQVGNRTEGATSPDGRVAGSYLHGMFAQDAFRAHWLTGFATPSNARYADTVEDTLDALAAHLGRNMDVDALFASAR